jgi:nucleotide-binding universal stress UspA family protein
MFHKILVGLDRSDQGEQVFAEAVALAKATGASLMLLHVLSQGESECPQMPSLSTLEYYPGLQGSMMDTYKEEWHRYEAAGMEWLRSHTTCATDAGVPTEMTQMADSPGRAICALARTWDADLILVGRRGLVGLQEFFLGSTSNYVMHHAPCSVLVTHLNPAVTSESDPQSVIEQPIELAS